MNNKPYKTTYNYYSVWEYEEEINDLNEASKNGWQLLKGGQLHSKYTYDTSKRYIYQLDYNPSLKDKQNYLSFFEEQNWEFINSTFNGWHYFRKPYHENMSEIDSQIYTDKQSLHEMEDRWLRILAILATVYFLLSIVYISFAIKTKEMGFLIESTMFVFLTIVFSLVLIQVSKKKKANYQDYSFQ